MRLSLKMIFRCHAAALVAWLCSASTFAQGPRIELLGKGSVPGTASDLSGLSEQLTTGSRADQFGGLSAIEYSGDSNRFIALSDRGPGDGAARFACRFHDLQLDLDRNTKVITCKVLKTTQFRNQAGEPLSGSLEALASDVRSHAPAGSHRAMDPEGFRPFEDNLLVSDEYGPRVSLFDRQGKWLRDLELPSLCRLNPEPQAGGSGVFTNRGLEGISFHRESRSMIAALQGPMLQDGALENGKCLGVNTRWFAIDASGKTRQWVYPLDDETSGVSEVLHWDEKRVLVLERDSLSGLEAKIKRIYVAYPDNATDVSNVRSLPRKGLPADVQPVRKELLIDLLDPRFGLGGEEAAEKPEGLCWGKPQDDGARTLWISVDNDFDPAVTTKFYAFSVKE